MIGRNTAFTFKGKAVDLKQIGREFNVRYVLEGSVQRGGNRMRVNVQLIDAETGNHLWAERFDKPFADLFDMQDEIVARLANQLGTELMAAEARRAQEAPNPDSVDLYFQGLASFNQGITLENMAQARVFLSAPWSSIRTTSTHCSVSGESTPMGCVLSVGRSDPRGLSRGRSDDRQGAFSKAKRSIGPRDLGGVLHQTKRPDQAIAELERALALDPNLAAAHGEIGLAKFLSVAPGDRSCM